jgi:hypothetical protein
LIFDEFLRTQQIKDHSEITSDTLFDALKVTNYQLSGLRSIRAYPVYYQNGNISVRPNVELPKLAA